MKQHIALFLSVFLIQISIAQNHVYVEYEHGEFFKNYSNTEVLIANKEMAKYDILERKVKEKSKLAFTDETSNTINTIDNESIKPRSYYTKFNQGVVFFEDYIDDTKYFIADTIPALHWEIDSSKTKVINGYECGQAKLSFRGSSFTAYFTKEIPMSFGPWKFSGLPGLILEITLDDNHNYYWKATKIIYPYKNKTSINLTYTDQFSTSLETFIKKWDKFNRDEAIKEATRVSKAIGEPGNFFITLNRSGPEKIYEWEQK